MTTVIAILVALRLYQIDNILLHHEAGQVCSPGTNPDDDRHFEGN